MRVDHLRCALMNPPGMSGLPAHVLLCHTDAGLVLVDTGFGTADLADPAERLGPVRNLLRPDTDPAHTALHQLRALGHDPEEVTHVVLTHLDLDHVGGIADFPGATIHTTAEEYAAATSPDLVDRGRYRPQQLAHGPIIRTHEGRGDEWRFGLTAHEVLPGIALVPMPGHSLGHAAVAVDAEDGRTVVHAGDAAFDASSYTDTSPEGRPLGRVLAGRAFEMTVGRDRRAVLANHRTLRRLANLPDVLVVPAHDKRITDELVAR